MSGTDKNKTVGRTYGLLQRCGGLVSYMPSTSRCCLPQHQMWDVLLLVPPPLKDRGELVAKVSIGVQKCVKEHSHRVP